MSEQKPREEILHAHPGGRRCCGRLLSEKCSPQEEAEKTNQATGEKTCCKGHHKQ